MKRMYSRFLVGAAIAALSAIDPTAGLAQTTFQACRIPNVGAIYMINVAGAPAACLDASHVAFSWTEGGAPAAGSVTSTMIADGTIATVDVANGAITQAKLDAGVSFPLADGAVTSNKILDGGVAAIDHAASSVNSAAIVDGAIVAADLAANSVNGSKLGYEVISDGVSFTRNTSYIYNRAYCSAGKVAVGGGYINSFDDPAEGWEVHVYANEPEGSNWFVSIYDPGAADINQAMDGLTVYVICVNQ